MMTDENKNPKEPQGVESGFDLPGGDETPPPEGQPKAQPVEGFDLPEDSAVPAPFLSAVGEPAGIEPHVAKEEQRKPKQAIVGKLIALVGIPVVAIVLLFVLKTQRQQPYIEYQNDCVKTGTAFLMGMSDNTPDSVPAAYELLQAETRINKDVESVEEGYKTAAAGLGAFKSLDKLDWESAPRGKVPQAFDAVAVFEKGTMPVWFSFFRVDTGDGKTEMRIADYKLRK